MTTSSSDRRHTGVPSTLTGRTDAQLITDARPSADAELRSRRRRYTLLMLIHLVGLAVGGLLYRDAWTLGLIILIVTGPLQWVAVIVANDSRRPHRTASRIMRRRGSATMPGWEITDEKERHQVVGTPS